MINYTYEKIEQYRSTRDIFIYKKKSKLVV